MSRMFSREWRRFVRPYLAISGVITVGTAIAYSHGAPVWVVYAGCLLAAVVVLPGHERWERTQR